MKTIIIEDQQYPLEALERAVKAVGISQYDVAHHYVQARNFILKNTYDLVLLDHRMLNTSHLKHLGLRHEQVR